MSARLYFAIGDLVTGDHMDVLDSQSVIIAPADDALPPVGIADGTLASVPLTGTLWIRSQGGWYRMAKTSVRANSMSPVYTRRDWADGQTPTAFQINSLNVRSVQVSERTSTNGPPAAASSPVPANEIGTIVAGYRGSVTWLYMWVYDNDNTIALKRLTAGQSTASNSGIPTSSPLRPLLTSSQRLSLAMNGYEMWVVDRDAREVKIFDCLSNYHMKDMPLPRTLTGLPQNSRQAADAGNGHCVVRASTSSTAWPTITRHAYTSTAVGAATHTWPTVQDTYTVAKAHWPSLPQLYHAQGVMKLTPHRTGGLLADVSGMYLAWSPSPGAAWQVVTEHTDSSYDPVRYDPGGAKGASWLSDDWFIWNRRFWQFYPSTATARTESTWSTVTPASSNTYVVGYGRRQQVWIGAPTKIDLDTVPWDA